MGNFQRPFPLKVPYFSCTAAILLLLLPPQGGPNRLECVQTFQPDHWSSNPCSPVASCRSSKGGHEPQDCFITALPLAHLDD